MNTHINTHPQRQTHVGTLVYTEIGDTHIYTQICVCVYIHIYLDRDIVGYIVG